MLLPCLESLTAIDLVAQASQASVGLWTSTTTQPVGTPCRCLQTHSPRPLASSLLSSRSTPSYCSVYLRISRKGDRPHAGACWLKHQPDWDGNFDLAATNLVRALESEMPTFCTHMPRDIQTMRFSDLRLCSRDSTFMAPYSPRQRACRQVADACALSVCRRSTVVAPSKPPSAMSIQQHRRGWPG